MKKVISILIALSTFLVAVTGCSSDESSGSTEGTTTVAVQTEGNETTPPASEDNPYAMELDMEPEDTDLSGTIKYWSSFSGDSAAWDQARVDAFNKIYQDKGISVEVQFVPEGAGINNGKLLSAIASGAVPDVIITDQPTSAYSYAANGSFEPLDDILEKTNIPVDDFFDGCKDIIYYQDTAYLIPQDANVILLYYNPEIASEAGLDPENPPKTIAELDEWADAMTVPNSNGGFDRFGFIPWLDSGEDAWVVPYIAFGSTPYDASTNQLNMTSPELTAYFEWVKSYADKYDPEKIQAFTSGLGGMFSPDHAFMTGKVGMTITGNWFSNALKVYAPDVAYEVCAVPVAETGRANSTTFGVNVFAIPKGAANPDLAALFIKFCLSGQVNESNFATWRSIPTIDAEFDNVSLTISGDKMYALEREIANSPENGVPALCAVASELSTAFQTFRESVIYSNADIAGGLKDLQDQYQKELDS